MRLAIVALLALVPLPALAQSAPPASAAMQSSPADPARLRVARDLMDAMMIERLFTTMFEPMLANVQTQLVDQMTRGSPVLARQRAQDPAFDERLRRTNAIIAGEMTTFFRLYMPRMIEGYANTYARVYTLPELQAQVAFFRTPLGREVARKQPEIAAVGVGELGREMFPALMERMKGVEAKIKAATADLPPPSKPTER